MEELYEKSYMLASNCLQHNAQLLSKRFWAQTMKRSRTFQSSATDDAVAVQKVLAFIKACTPATLMLGALEGSPLFYNRQDFQDCDSLVKELVTYDPYIKKSTLEAGLVILDNEHRKQLSKAASCQGFWAKQEAFALKEQVMKSIKRAHNSTRWSRPRNMDTVVKALLDKKEGHSLESPGPEASTLTGAWIDKHKRLLRRRSSETDVIFVKGPPVVPDQPGPDQQDSRKTIFALYGLTDSASSTDKVHDTQDPIPADLVDLTLSPAPKGKDIESIEDTTPKGKSKMYFDMCKNKVVRAFRDGTLEEAETEKGPGGFLIGVFADGQTFTTEVPNVSWGLASRKALQEEEDRKKEEAREEKKIAKAKAKAEAKEKSKAEAKEKAKPKAKAKPKMNSKEHEDKKSREVEKQDLPAEVLEPAAQQSEQRVEDQHMYCTCSCQQPLHNVMRMCLGGLVSCMHHAGPRHHPGGEDSQGQEQDLHPGVLGQPQGEALGGGNQ